MDELRRSRRACYWDSRGRDWTYFFRANPSMLSPVGSMWDSVGFRLGFRLRILVQMFAVSNYLTSNNYAMSRKVAF